jgi:threonine/homoserine/homoserine lactone efflux protein
VVERAEEARMFEIGGIEILPELPRFVAFVLAGLALNIIPGADMTFVMASAARGGTRSGLAAALGIGAGALVHIAAAVVGLSALIASSQAAFAAVKWLGAAFLLYLAFTMVRGGGGAGEAARPVPASNWKIFRAGALVNILNPKVGLFFLAFLPQFVDPQATVPAVQILALGLWFDFAGTIVNAVVAVATARAAMRLRGVAWIGKAARWVGATMMAALAVRLAVSERG